MNLEAITMIIDKYHKEATSELKKSYVSSLDDFLNNNGIKEEILPIIFQGYDIDNGSTLNNFIGTLSSTNLKKTISLLKQSEYIKKDRTGNAYEIIFGMLYTLIINEKKYNKHIPKAFELLIQKIKNDGGVCTSGGYTKSFIMVFVKSVAPDCILPKWDKLNINSKLLEAIISALLPPLEIIDDESNNPSVDGVLRWLESGKAIIPELKKKEEKEKLLNSLLIAEKDELSDFLDQFDEEINLKKHEIIRLKNYNEELKRNLYNKELEIIQLNAEITKRERIIKEESQKRKLAEKEVEERKDLNQTQVHYQKMSISSLKDEIGEALRTEFEDFFETIDNKMSNMLGEIYRDKLNQIAKILEQKDIKVK